MLKVMMRHRKLLLSLTVAVLLIAAFSLGTKAAQPVFVTLNGEQLDFDVQPLLENGRLLVPLRRIAEALNARVEYLEDHPAVIITRGNKRIELQPGEKRVLRDGKEITLETAPLLSDSRVLVPLRFVSEALGAEVEWYPYLRTAAIWDSNYSPEDGDDLREPQVLLPVVGSYENLKKLLAETENYGIYGEDAKFSVRDSGSEMAQKNIAEEATPASTPEDYSTTNIQVQGVDEADIVKTDGKYIYQVNNKRIAVIKAYPAAEMELLSLILFSDKGFTPQELYLDENRLVVIGTSYKEIPSIDGPVTQSKERIMIYPPPYYRYSTVKTIVFDISDRENIKQLREVELEGHYASSRKIGTALYLVANKNIDFYSIMGEGMENPTPSYRDTALKDEFINIDYTKIRYFPGFARANYMILAGLDLREVDEAVEIHTFLGSGENIYASLENLYVAVTGYEAASPGEPRRHANTSIYRFALNEGKIKYAAAGKVAGTILNQFSMDEYGGHFRIATTTGDIWRSNEETAQNNIYILNSALNVKGKIEGIAPGEKIYAVRFMGKKGYMVTFRTIDPLFVLDLENPQAPRVLGALKIPGYSDYLHPYDENHLLGFGKETMEIVQKDARGNITEVSAIDLGMKMALFDVSDVHNPVEKFTEIIGERGTNSELLRNHKALLFSREKDLLAFPITVLEVREGANRAFPEYGQFTFQGACIYNLDLQDGFQLKGKISHLTEEDYLRAGRYWYDSNKSVERILSIGDILYTLSRGFIKANALDDLREIKTISVPAK